MAAILAAPFSGATLLSILLAHHPDLSSDGETFPLHDGVVTCSCGQAQIDCPYYRQAAAHMLGPDGRSWDRSLFAPHPTYSRLPLVDRALGWQLASDTLHLAQSCLRWLVPAWRRRSAEFVGAHLRFVENSLRLRGAKVYVDGVKAVRRARLFADCPHVRLKVIHLVRDGRGFCYSYLKNNKLPRTRLPDAARAWLKENQAAERFKARWPHVPALDLRYEDVCADLPGSLRRICAFLEVPYEPAMESASAANCHVLGNRMRLTFSGQVEQCLRWQQEFSPGETAYLNWALWAGLERYGYSQEGGCPPAPVPAGGASQEAPHSALRAASTEPSHPDVQHVS
jgi:hypothetical protein